MSDIFISYAAEDRATAKSLAELLKQRGWSVWWDRVIPIGKTFDRVIEEALDSAKCVLVLWSKSSVTSHWVITEANEGLNRGALIPVKIEETKIPLGFRRLQTANLIGWQAGQENPEVTMMLEAITQIVGAPLLEVPSKFELGNDLKLIKTPKTKATQAKEAQAKTVFQQELLQLIEFAKNHFEDIRKGRTYTRTDGYTGFESGFSISEAKDNNLVLSPNGKYYFASSLLNFVEEQKAIALFNMRAAEIKSILNPSWVIKDTEDPYALLMKRLQATHNKDKLEIMMGLSRFRDGNCNIDLFLSEL